MFDNSQNDDSEKVIYTTQKLETLSKNIQIKKLVFNLIAIHSLFYKNSNFVKILIFSIYNY